jgi:hypothetical protein
VNESKSCFATLESRSGDVGYHASLRCEENLGVEYGEGVLDNEVFTNIVRGLARLES